MLDVGTNSKKHLNDPNYRGLQKPRVTGTEYDLFIEAFIYSVKNVQPDVFLHFEDFTSNQAHRNLKRAQHLLLTFNDDMQGTAMITIATIFTALHKTGDRKLKDQRILFAGAGTAATGIGLLMAQYMEQFEGVKHENAFENLFFIDSRGLVYDRKGLSEDVSHPKHPFVKSREFMMKRFGVQKDSGKLNVEETVGFIKPTILIGVSSQYNSFTQQIVETMSAATEHPIILPLSNPHSKCEVIPENAIKWSKGKAFIATGSPFKPVEFNGEKHIISQCNNAFIFPGLTQGMLASRARTMTDKMAHAAYSTLAKYGAATKGVGQCLPYLEDLQKVNFEIAVKVAG